MTLALVIVATIVLLALLLRKSHLERERQKDRELQDYYENIGKAKSADHNLRKPSRLQRVRDFFNK